MMYIRPFGVGFGGLLMLLFLLQCCLLLLCKNIRPYHTKLVLNSFWKMLPNGRKLCANGVEVVDSACSNRPVRL